jgi:hypothetical protein
VLPKSELEYAITMAEEALKQMKPNMRVSSRFISCLPFVDHDLLIVFDAIIVVAELGHCRVSCEGT